MRLDRREPAPRSGDKDKLRPAAIVFDYGNVLSLPQQPADVEELSALCGIVQTRFQHLYWRFRAAYDSGRLTAQAYWGRVAREENKEFTELQVRQIVEVDARSWSRANQDTLRWVGRLREAGFTLALLSNMPLEIKNYLLGHCEWLQDFHSLVFSCDVNAVKPDAAIYRRCLSELQRMPHEVLFFDDRQENVDGARELGMHACLFDNVDQAAARAGERFDLSAFQLPR